MGLIKKLLGRARGKRPEPESSNQSSNEELAKMINQLNTTDRYSAETYIQYLNSKKK